MPAAEPWGIVKLLASPLMTWIPRGAPLGARCGPAGEVCVLPDLSGGGEGRRAEKLRTLP